MDAPGRPAPESLSQRLREAPRTFEWLQALLLLERERPDAVPLGEGSLPAAEALRLRGALAPLFEPTQVTGLEDHPERPALSTALFGLGGADGALPYAYQEWLMARRQQRDDAPAAFLDLFQHRLLSLLYRAMRRHRLALGYQPPAQGPAQRPLQALSGMLATPAAALLPGGLPDSAVLARAALFNGSRRSLAGFAGIVRRQFNVAAHCSAYAGSWQRLPKASRSRLGHGAPNLVLGRNAVAGTRTWDEHAGYHLTLGPLDNARAAEFLPEGSTHRALAALSALYFGPDLDCQLTLRLRSDTPLSLQRQQPPRLNWNVGLRRADSPPGERCLSLRLQQTEWA